MRTALLLCNFFPLCVIDFCCLFIPQHLHVCLAQATSGKFSGKKLKKAPNKPQWLIMRDMGLTDEEISVYQDPEHWLKVFPNKVCASGARDVCCSGWNSGFFEWLMLRKMVHHV